MHFEGSSLTLPKLWSTRTGHGFFIAPVITIIRASWHFLSNAANIWSIVDILLMVAKDKTELAVSNGIKTLKEVFAIGAQSCALDEATKIGRGQSFQAYFRQQRQTSLLDLSGKKGKKILTLSALVNMCKPRPYFISPHLL